MNSPQPTERPSSQLLLSVAVISAAILGFEVSLTRLFSVLLRYHFAFLVISVALCGLGIGGYLAQWLRRKGQLSLPTSGLLFSVSSVVSLVLILQGVFRYSPEAYWLSALLVLAPFTFGGVFLAEAFARHSRWSGRLYAWDLAGAAIAAIGIVGVLQIFGAINACLVAAALGVLAAYLSATKEEEKGKPWLALLPVILIVLPLVNGNARLLDIPAIPPKLDENQMSLSDKGVTQMLFTELGTPGHTSKIVDTRWNAFARTDVVYDTEDPSTFLVYTNGNVPTNLVGWDGKRFSLPQITRNPALVDWVFCNAPIGDKSYRKNDLVKVDAPKGRVLSIGPGGGLDALMALRYGAADFDGAEINPSIVGLMHEPKYHKFSGGVYSLPNVHVRTADGRDAVREAIHQGKRYSLIYSALTKTATASQGMALLESFIYTEDAFADYFDALTDDGQMAIVTDKATLIARLYTTSLAMLRSRGINEKEASKHIALALDKNPYTPYRFSIMVSKKPLTKEQTYALSDTTSSRGLAAIWLPERAALTTFGPYPSVADGSMNLEQFVAWWLDKSNVATIMGTPPGGDLSQIPQLDMSPCPDDRPFVLDQNPAQLPIFKQLIVGTIIMGLLLAALSWGGREATAQTETGTALSQWLYILYFFCLGVGFMLVEIPLAQKLILPLGYPTLALTVILFSVLLGGGAGSWFSQRFENSQLRTWAITCAIGVALLSLAAGQFSGNISQLLLGMPLTTRCIVVGIGLLPFGFLLGTPFPSGMRLFARHFSGHVPLTWGLNGVASVVGSMAAAMGAKAFGFGVALMGGAGVYLVAAALLYAASTANAAQPATKTRQPAPEPEVA